MNKIRYRAFDKHMKAMGEVTSIKFFEHMYDHVSVRFAIKGKTTDENYNVGYDGSDNITLMQYTGLKDKNGMEIFEGDIVACGDGKVPTEIRWVQESSAFMAYNIKRKEYHLLNKYFGRFIGEVIGNIYDNPELTGDRAELIQNALEWLEDLDA